MGGGGVEAESRLGVREEGRGGVQPRDARGGGAVLRPGAGRLRAGGISPRHALRGGRPRRRGGRRAGRVHLLQRPLPPERLPGGLRQRRAHPPRYAALRRVGRVCARSAARGRAAAEPLPYGSRARRARPLPHRGGGRGWWAIRTHSPPTLSTPPPSPPSACPPP